MTRGPAAVALALLFLLFLLPGCAAGPPPPAPPQIALQIPPALAGVSADLAQAARTGRASSVLIRKQANLVKSGSAYGWGLLKHLAGVLDPLDYGWPRRVVTFPLYLLFGWIDLSTSRGSGFFVSEDLVLTNAHVVQNAASLTLLLPDGRSARGAVVAVDEARDLALLRAEGLPGPPPPPLELRRDLGRVGEPVLAVGYPTRETFAGWDPDSGPANPRVTAGLVSAREVELGNDATRYLETDAALNPGNSGGPLLGLDGRVLGVTTMIGAGKQNEGYAVPSVVVLAVFAEHLDPVTTKSPQAVEAVPGPDGGD